MTWYQDGYDDGFKAGKKAAIDPDTVDPIEWSEAYERGFDEAEAEAHKDLTNTDIFELNEEIRALADARFGHLGVNSPPDEIVRAALDLIRGKPR